MRRTHPASSARTLGLMLAAIALLAFILPAPASAQAVSGTILGVVRDSSGAVLPGTSVTLVNTGTGLSRTVVTDSQGEYTAPLLPTGTYTVNGDLSGFKKVSMANVHLGVDQKIKVDLKLEVGQLDRGGGDPGRGAAPPDLVLRPRHHGGRGDHQGPALERPQLRGPHPHGSRHHPRQPRVQHRRGGSLAWRASASFSANGQRPRDNNYLLDGVDNNETWLQTVVIFPSVDAIDEFKLQTSTFSAEFGRSMGGVVNLQIKSGNNQFHGSAFEFHRNDQFDANNWFNNRAGRAKPDFKQNQFGGTLSGPIIKDKTFFFADYQGMRINQGLTFVSTVPSDLMRQGNFSEINRPIYDPVTGAALPRERHPLGPLRSRFGERPERPHPRRELGGNAQRPRPDHQQLRDQPPPDPPGQPVRRQDRPRAVRQQPVLRALQLPEDPPRPARHPAPRRRRQHLRRRRGEHQGPELRLQRRPHLQPEPG